MNTPNNDAPEKLIEEEIKESPVDEKISAAKPANRSLSIWRRLLRWLLGILIFFSLGALTVIFMLYIPARRELMDARQQLDVLNTQNSTDLQAANEEIDRLTSIEASNQDLQIQLDQAILSQTLLQIRLDIANAQLALSKEDTAKAKLALSKTAETIQKLASLLPQSHLETIESLQERLKLVLSELEGNAFAANSDLDVITNLLLELENSLNR